MPLTAENSKIKDNVGSSSVQAYRPSLQRYMTGPIFEKQQISKWMYASDHHPSAIMQSGYFNGVANITKGDVIECVMNVKVKPVLKLLVVLSVEDGVVHVAGVST